ncbi:hypothetical protein FQZ97_582640 [compost metagenome]
MSDGRHALHLGQAEDTEQLDPGPAHVELPLLHRELGGVRVGVMVVVQLFAADEDAPGHQVGGGVAAFEVAVADSMAQAIDNAGGPDGNPGHLHGPDGDAGSAEQRQVDQRHQHHAADGVAAVDVALHPVIRAVLAIDAQGFLVFRLDLVELGALAQDGPQALDHRAVGVVDGFALGVVLAVDGGPLAGVHGGGHPQPEAEEMLERRMELQRTVRRITVQIDGDADDGDMGQHQGDRHQLPQRQVKESVVPHGWCCLG